MTIQHPPDAMQLEVLARDSGKSLDTVEHLYQQEYAALAEHARIPNYIAMLAMRRVRYRLQSLAPELVH